MVGSVDLEFDGNFVTANYQRAYTTGICCMYKKPLSELVKACGGLSIEFSPIKDRKEDGLHFLDGFRFNPPINIDIAQPKKYIDECIVITHSLDKTKNEELIKSIIEHTDIKTIITKPHFINTLQEVGSLWSSVYDLCIAIANNTQEGFDKIHGLVRYSYFLCTYPNKKYNEAIGLASKKFNLENIIPVLAKNPLW